MPHLARGLVFADRLCRQLIGWAVLLAQRRLRRLFHHSQHDGCSLLLVIVTFKTVEPWLGRFVFCTALLDARRVFTPF